jgi:hypothetical protein
VFPVIVAQPTTAPRSLPVTTPTKHGARPARH